MADLLIMKKKSTSPFKNICENLNSMADFLIVKSTSPFKNIWDCSPVKVSTIMKIKGALSHANVMAANVNLNILLRNLKAPKILPS